jgi:hypothetical protein
MSEKEYVIAPKRDSAEAPPDDWHDRLAEIEGVSVRGATRRRAQFTASNETAEKVRSELGDRFHIEEVVERKPL